MPNGTLGVNVHVVCRKHSSSQRGTAISSQLFQANPKNTYLIINPFLKHSDSCTGVRVACWKHKHSGDQLSVFAKSYCPNASPLRLLNSYKYSF